VGKTPGALHGSEKKTADIDQVYPEMAYIERKRREKKKIESRAGVRTKKQ